MRLKKHLGQHLLESPEILAAIVRCAGVEPGDGVLEIGPGPGTLTHALAERVGAQGRVLAIELDRAWMEPLATLQRAHPQVEVRWEDALRTDLAQVLEGRATWRCVANIPYYITSPLVTRLLDARAHFSTLALLMQREVAERLHARKGRDVGMLSHWVHYHADTEVALIVPASAFRPPPKVESALLLLRPRATPPVEMPFETMRPIIAAAFAARRKMLRGALRTLTSDSETLDAWLARAKVAGTARAEDLDLADFARLAQAAPTH